MRLGKRKRMKNDLSLLIDSDDLRNSAKVAAKRWLDDSKWRPIPFEQYFKFLEEIQSIKKDLHAPDLPHPKMTGEKFTI